MHHLPSLGPLDLLSVAAVDIDHFPTFRQLELQGVFTGVLAGVSLFGSRASCFDLIETAPIIRTLGTADGYHGSVFVFAG